MKTTAQKIEVMQAYVDGKKIQGHVAGEWCDFEGEPNWQWFSNDYRVKPLEPDSINWDHVAPAFKFMARDEDGTVWLYDGLPSAGYASWHCGGKCTEAHLFSSLKVGGMDWKDSLMERPEASA